MLSPNLLVVGLIGTNSGTDYYFRIPYRCTLVDLIAIASATDPGDADTLAFYDSDANLIGTATFGSTIAAGAKATYVASTTLGKHVLDKDEVCYISVSALDAAGDRINVQLQLDPYASSDDDFDN